MKVIDDIEVILGKKKAVQPPQEEKKPSPRILIVEDDQILLEMYKDKFVKEGFLVLTAENGQLGLEKAKTEKPDLILLDLMMPVMDGKAMLRRLREIPEFSRLPVIVLTNAGEVENIRETQHFDKAVEFLIKSNVSVDEVVEKAKFWLNALL